MPAKPNEDDDYADFDNDDCWNCDGEGYVSSCLDEIGCIDPESGCDYCTRRCEVCNPPKRLTDDRADRARDERGGE